MKYFLMLCLGIAAASCSSDPEDKTFFGGGWMHPESGADQRIANPATLMPVKNEYAKSPLVQPEEEPSYPMEQKSKPITSD